MPRDDSFRNFILDQLADLPEVECRAMFGGLGIYQGDVFFAIIHRDRLYFKTDETTRKKYEELGQQPFRPSAKQTLSSYYEVPADVIEDMDRLADWAREAVRVQKGS